MRPKECIFCGGKPLSKEHVWPKWLRPYIALKQKNHTSMSAIVHGTHREETRRRWGGDVQSHSVRIVCQSCNSGWMSQLQEKAKPSLLPLITGQPIRLNADDQLRIAFWCAMSAMNAEFLSANQTAISADDRRSLKNGRLSPDTWKIWIGHYQRGDWVGAWAHNMMRVESGEVAEPTPDGHPAPNTQTTTLVVGQLYAHIFSSVFPEVVRPVNLGNRGSRLQIQIWPVADEAIWPPPETMTDQDADIFADAIFETLYQIAG